MTTMETNYYHASSLPYYVDCRRTVTTIYQCACCNLWVCAAHYDAPQQRYLQCREDGCKHRSKEGSKGA